MKQVPLLGEAWDAKSLELTDEDTDTWLTPMRYIDRARKTMGSIDCDPASNDAANQRIGATVFYTPTTNGLLRPWEGNVWWNPPYSRGLITAFTDKLLLELREGRSTQAIALVNAKTDTAWFHDLMGQADAMCLHKGRISFDRPGQEAAGKGFFGQVFFYFGPWVDEFRANFEAFGRVLLLG